MGGGKKSVVKSVCCVCLYLFIINTQFYGAKFHVFLHSASRCFSQSCGTSADPLYDKSRLISDLVNAVGLALLKWIRFTRPCSVFKLCRKERERDVESLGAGWVFTPPHSS